MANTTVRPLRVDVRVRNNIILKMMEEMGIMSIAELAKQACMDRGPIDNIINMKTLPLRTDGSWMPSVARLAEFLGCSPEEMFSDEQLKMELAKNRASAEVTFGEFQALIASQDAERQLPEYGLDVLQQVEGLLASLNSQQEKVIRLRFGIGKIDDDGCSQDEVAELIGLSKGRVAQIEVGALQRLARKVWYGTPIEKEYRRIDFSQVVAVMEKA